MLSKDLFLNKIGKEDINCTIKDLFNGFFYIWCYQISPTNSEGWSYTVEKFPVKLKRIYR